MDSLPNGINAAYLTEALRKAGTLGAGCVKEVSIKDSRNTILSRIVRLQLEYDGDCKGAPQSLILKTSLPERLKPGWKAGQHEVEFYTRVAAVTPSEFLPRCFDAVFGAEGNTWHLLLEDLTDSHYIVTAWPMPPSAMEATRIVQARARFQAAWWDNACFGTTVGKWSSLEDIKHVLQRFEGKFAHFVDLAHDVLTPARRTLYEQLIDAGPRLSARYLGRQNMTIVHGDGHFWNCFLSKDGDGVKFFDWDNWRVDVGTDDLAYMIAMHWYPDRRRQLERTLLDRYHETLVTNGVNGYDRQALDDDYRLSVLWQIMTPVWQAGIEIPPRIWWNNFERIMMAVDDLGCRDLLS